MFAKTDNFLEFITKVALIRYMHIHYESLLLIHIYVYHPSNDLRFAYQHFNGIIEYFLKFVTCP